MSKKAAVPDAWDDDWESLADKSTVSPSEEQKEVKVTKAERKAQHAQANKALWDSAEAPEPQPFFLAARGSVPTQQTDFKPTIKVLSRRPPPQIASRNSGGGVASEMAGMKLQDDEDSEEEERRKAAESFAERQAKALREREEKQRKYDEMREKLFGPSPPPQEESQGRSSPSNRQPRGKGRGRGGNHNSNASSADQSPARGPMPKKQLYDPSYSAKPNSIYIQKREAAESSSGPGTPTEQQPIRAPRGPDGSSGFAGRGRGRASGTPA